MLNKRICSSFALLLVLMLGFSACMTKKKLARLKSEYQILRTGMDSLGAIKAWEERRFKPGDRVLVTIKTQSLNEQQLVFFDNGREMDLTIANDSTITLPLVGEINACEFNRPQLTKHIQQRVAQFIKDPYVLIKPVQIQVKILGQAERQGVITMPENDATLISLIAQVGGVSQFARRDSLLVIREQDGALKNYYVNLRDGGDLFSSPVYRLQQNDIVVIQPSNYFFKAYRNQENSINLGRITPLATVFGIVFLGIQLLTLVNR